MPLAAYPDLSWLIRAVRVLPVVAVAATVGGIIGGFTIFAIDSALTWQPRPEFRADSQAAIGEQQGTRPVRIVGGAIPDPSAGMSAPPPAPQQRAASTQPAQMPAQLLTAQPLGAAQPLTQTKTQVQTPQSQPPPASAQPIPSQIPNAAASQQQSTRWPDALSRARQGSGGVQQQTEAPQPNATPERSVSRNSDADRKDAGDERAGNERAASASDDDHTGASRRGRHGRWRTMMSDVPRNGAGDETDMSSARGAKRLDARAYNRVYNSYGGARDDDQDRAAALRSSKQRRFGSDERYYSRRGTVVRERPDEADKAPAVEAAGPRAEPFWGGGFIRRDDRSGGIQDEGD
ncbi:MAG TPA: hypothetical protein VK653_18715 [Xanthobacteraceae bacterium]|nr:hypothetical protein [Xanthobacteraceae bacterium]